MRALKGSVIDEKYCKRDAELLVYFINHATFPKLAFFVVVAVVFLL